MPRKSPSNQSKVEEKRLEKAGTEEEVIRQHEKNNNFMIIAPRLTVKGLHIYGMNDNSLLFCSMTTDFDQRANQQKKIIITMIRKRMFDLSTELITIGKLVTGKRFKC